MRHPPEIFTLALPAAATLPALAIDPSGGVVVAWSQETRGNPAIWVQRWRSSKWESLGSSAEGRGAGGTVGEAYAPSVAIDSAGNPVIAWQDRSYGSHEIYFRRWNGSRWEELAGSATEGGVSKTNTGYSGFPSLALDSHGLPTVAWEEHYGSKSDIWVRRYVSGLLKHGWVDVGDHPGLVGFPAKISDAVLPSLALDARGNPMVAWIDNQSGSDQVYLRVWSGSRWEELGGSGSAAGVSHSPKPAASVNLKPDASGNPVLSWKEGSGGDAVLVVKRWNGREWETMVAPAEAGSNPTWPGLAMDVRGNPVLAWRGRDEVCIRRWSGKGWEAAAEVPWHNPPAFTLPTKRLLAFAAGAGKACAAWVEGGPQPAIRMACVRLSD